MSKILVIEDEDSVREVIVATLQLQGFETFEAANGVPGVQLARERLPDLILCDIRMPVLDGFGTLEALRRDSKTATIPFIFLTAFADRAEMRLGMEMGADDYLSKPFTLSELLATVDTRLKKQTELRKRSEEILEELRTNITLALPHELLTPLNGITGYAAVLMEDHKALTPEEVLECAQCIDTSARRLQRLIENFMVYSQIELILTDPRKSASVVTTAPLRTTEMIQLLAEQRASRIFRQTDLQLDLEEAVVAIRADYFAKIVEELVDNALKFSQAGTPVKVSMKPDGKRYCLTVSDCGRGMTPDQIKRVGAHMQFERRLYEQQGLGLGLIIAKRLVDLHGGEMRIKSAPNQGATIKVFLPGVEATDVNN